jgi:hypothetical protein
LAATVLVAGAVVAACGSGNGGTGSSMSSTSSLAPSTSAGASGSLPQIVVRAVTEERHVLATYQNVVARLGGMAPFTNVAASEQTHVDALVGVANAHGVDVSQAASTGDASPATRPAACRLGVDAEKAVVALYDELLPQVGAYPDVVRVFTNVRAASLESHLPAFEHCS